MYEMFLAIRFLPILIRIAEIAIGAGKGEVKKELVVSTVLSILQSFGVPVDPSFVNTISEAIDAIVGVLNQTVWKK